MTPRQHRTTNRRRLHLHRLSLAVGFILICLLATAGCGEEIRSSGKMLDDPTNFATFPIRMYQAYISSAIGHRCPMMPSCSQYAVEAFKKHGYLLGWIMASDRLLRCGRDETRLSKTYRKNNETYSYDPLRNNDFWWR